MWNRDRCCRSRRRPTHDGAALFCGGFTPFAAAAIILAHGAGAPQRHPFMVSFARALSERGVDVLTFNFLYTEQRRKVPDRMPQLVACYRAVIDVARVAKSQARASACSSAANRWAVARRRTWPRRITTSLDGIVLLGYPLHPPAAPIRLRDAHLPGVRRPMLFVQGSRDTFGTPSELKPILVGLAPLPTLHTVDGGDHSFKIAGRDQKARQAAVYAEIQDTIVEWIDRA